MSQEGKESGDTSSPSWHILAERVATEPDPQKLSLLLEKLCDVLEQAEKPKTIPPAELP